MVHFRLKTFLLFGMAVMLVFLASGSPRPGGEEPDNAAIAQAEPPNIVFILTDDMRKDDLSYMPNTRNLIQRRGTTFDNAFVTYSLCCPARATFLRGQYTHNHRVLTNAPSEHGSEVWFRKMGRDKSTVATWLDDAGYKTAHVGKYMNAYDDGYVPPGWDEWYTLSGPFHKELKLNENGMTRSYATSYIDEVLRKKADGFLKRNLPKADPVFLQVSTHAPHGPASYPPRYKDKFSNVKAPRPPSFNERNVSDKPGWLKPKNNIGKSDRNFIDTRHRDRLRSLLVVDDLVKDVTDNLRDAGELDNTYIVFTSDNGYHLGEHRIKVGKWTPYEEAIRIPLVVRGPGVPVGETRNEMVLNNDFAPTFADVGGAKIPGFVDGRSFKQLMQGKTPPWRKRFLVESWHSNLPSSPPSYQAVRTQNTIYTEYRRAGKVTDRELYSLRRDPYQLTSIHRTKNRKLVRSLDRQLSRLVKCKGAECRRAEGG